MAEATTDATGNYRLSFQGASSKTHLYAHLIARLDGHAIAWQRLNLDAPSTEASLSLVPRAANPRPPRRHRGTAGGRRPAARHARRNESERWRRDPLRPRDGKNGPRAWPAPVTSDKDGRFTLSGIAADQGVTLAAEGTERFAPQQIALNTGGAEQRGENDGTYRPLIKNAPPGEEMLLPLEPAHWFEGKVTYQDYRPAGRSRTFDDLVQPAGARRLVVGRRGRGRPRRPLSYQRGTGHSVLDHRFSPRRHGLPRPHGARVDPFAGRRPRWSGELELPRGVLVRGTVIEAGSGKPLAGATVRYIPEEKNNPRATDGVLSVGRAFGSPTSMASSKLPCCRVPAGCWFMVRSQAT